MENNARPEKVAVVDEVRQRLDSATAVVVTEYRGLTVAQTEDLRKQLRPAGGRYKVYKNTLARRAAREAGAEIDDMLVGPTALAFVEATEDGEAGDVVTVAKVLRDFAKANENLVVKGGLFDGAVIGADEVAKLADIEPREVLLAKLAGLMAAPMQQFAGLLQALPRDLAYGLQALIEKGGAAPAVDADASPAPKDGDAGDPAAAVEATDETTEDQTDTPETDGEGEE